MSTRATATRSGSQLTIDRRTLLRGAGVAGALSAAGLLVPATRAAAEPGGEISRDEVIDRAMFWVDDPRPYSMEGTSDGVDGKQWRRDCSGFACMSWNFRRSDGDIGMGTGQLPEVLTQITKDDLEVGDALLIPPWDNGASYGHVVLFNGWTNEARTEYDCLEQVGAPFSQTTRRTVAYPYDSGNAELYKPYRYPQIV